MRPKCDGRGTVQAPALCRRLIAVFRKNTYTWFLIISTVVPEVRLFRKIAAEKRSLVAVGEAMCGGHARDTVHVPRSTLCRSLLLRRPPIAVQRRRRTSGQRIGKRTSSARKDRWLSPLLINRLGTSRRAVPAVAVACCTCRPQHYYDRRLSRSREPRLVRLKSTVPIAAAAAAQPQSPLRTNGRYGMKMGAVGSDDVGGREGRVFMRKRGQVFMETTRRPRRWGAMVGGRYAFTYGAVVSVQLPTVPSVHTHSPTHSTAHPPTGFTWFGCGDRTGYSG